jgi:hypothetical protein
LGVVLAAVLWALPVTADEDQDRVRLAQLLQLDAFAMVIRADLLSSGDELAEWLLPELSAAPLRVRLSGIFDAEALRQGLNDRFVRAMPPDLAADAIAFYDTELGRALVEGELQASVATQDDDVDQAAQKAAEDLPKPRADVLSALIEANDLIELNLAGQMTTYARLQQGLARGGLLDMTEDEILADVWSTEEDLRADTARWAMGFLMLSYQALPNRDIQAYIAFARSPAGRAVNRALFDTYYGLYADSSLALGLALAQMAGAEKL